MPKSKRKRGRPRKYKNEAERRAARIANGRIWYAANRVRISKERRSEEGRAAGAIAQAKWAAKNGKAYRKAYREKRKQALILLQEALKLSYGELTTQWKARAKMILGLPLEDYEQESLEATK